LPLVALCDRLHLHVYRASELRNGGRPPLGSAPVALVGYASSAEERPGTPHQRPGFGTRLHRATPLPTSGDHGCHTEHHVVVPRGGSKFAVHHATTSSIAPPSPSKRIIAGGRHKENYRLGFESLREPRLSSRSFLFLHPFPNLPVCPSLKHVKYP
jgi:hypothetical protein